MIADDNRPVVDGDLHRSTCGGPLGGVVEQVCHGALDRRRHAVHHRLVQLRPERRSGAVALRALDGVGGDEIETNRLGLVRMLLGAGELDQLRDQRRHLAELLDDVLQQPLPLVRRESALAREYLDVRPQAGQRRAELVRRVGDELTLLAP